jgi:pimeloyl-ACP methyl ester carboxylesterase
MKNTARREITTVTHDNITICTESFGDRHNPALVLIMGACCSMLWWEDGFCDMLAAKGFFVIRYDNRDTGRSTTYPQGEPGYTFEDLADDAIHILDAHNIPKAVFMGMSLGGMFAQIIAVRHPERTAGIVLLSSMYFAEGAELLPGSADEVNDFFATPFDSDDPCEIIEHSVAQWKTVSRSNRPHDELHIRKMCAEDVARASNYKSTTNHALAQLTGNELLMISDINIPALVIHGTEDVVIPYIHGEMLAKTIPNATLITLNGAGHELHIMDYDAITGNIEGKFMK